MVNVKKKLMAALPAALAMLALTAGTALAELTKIADNIYAYVGTRNSSPANSYGANAGIVIGRDGVLVIDTLISAKQAEKFLADIRKVTDKPVRYVVNTHWHLDHTFGNEVFKRAGGVIIAQGSDKQAMEDQAEGVLRNAGEYGLTPELLAGTKLAYPMIAFSDRMTVDLGDIKVELIKAAPSHTKGSIVAFIPSRKVLFTGDVLFTGYHPYMVDGNIENWARMLDSVGFLKPEKIIPGHGPVSTMADLAEMKDYIKKFDAKAKELAKTVTDVDAFAEQMKKEMPQRPEGDWIIKANLHRYLQKPKQEAPQKPKDEPKKEEPKKDAQEKK